ncbi:hypothetical protein L204_103719 [Cryptococcus depauperatus]|nr:type 2C protein Phosphatase [Cryptococcus depauperatus CBS 7855]
MLFAQSIGHRLRESSYSTSSSPPPGANIKTTAFLSIALLTSAYLLYQYESSSKNTILTATPGGRPVTLLPKKNSTFQFNIQTNRGLKTFEFERKSDEEVEKMLRENENSQKVKRAGNPVIRWDNNWVGSNDPCEDRWANDLVPRKQTAIERLNEATAFWISWFKDDSQASLAETEGKRDLILFSIMDGHAGDATSRLLQKSLNPTIALALARLQAGHFPDENGWGSWSKYWSPWYYLGFEKIWTPENVSQTVQQAYLQLDDNICRTPIYLLPTVTSTSTDLSAQTARQTFVALAQSANAGACAITTLVDSESDDLYVALAGDCRAVAGWQGIDGQWRCDVLTEDQMGENPREIERIISEHPPHEKDTAIRKGRVLGGLQPTRAFGDAIYKWTNQQVAEIADMFSAEGQKSRLSRPHSYTPPYVTAKPEVAYRKLHSKSGEELKFIIMATDGLWDRLTSEEATLLVASYLAHSSHPPVYKTSLPKLFPLSSPLPLFQRLYPAQNYPQPEGETWVYEDDSNAATHLIRNSLAGGNLDLRAKLLSLTGKVSRWMRDDVTVTVIFFGNGQE